MRIRLIGLLGSLGAAVIIAACGGSGSGSGTSNGVAAKSPDQIIQASAAALAKTRTLRVHGAFVNAGSPTSLDLNLVNGRGGAGSLAQNGLSFQMVVLNNEVYIKGDKAFWQHYAGSAGASLLQGRWLKAPATGQLSSLAHLADVQTLFGAVTSSHGTLVKGKQTTVDGHKVIGITDTSKGGTLYVATSGPPYPVEITGSSSQKGSLIFDHFNQPVTLSAPTNAISLPVS